MPDLLKWLSQYSLQFLGDGIVISNKGFFVTSTGMHEQFHLRQSWDKKNGKECNGLINLIFWQRFLVIPELKFWQKIQSLG